MKKQLKMFEFKQGKQEYLKTKPRGFKSIQFIRN